jgi:hypothetical protein
MNPQTEEPEEHPLFPVDGDAEVPEINTIVVTRLNRTSGKYEYCRRDFPAAELTSLDELYENFGGGTYRLFGRGRAPDNPDSRPNARIRAQIDYDLPGPSKPLNEDETSGPPRAVGQAPVPPPAGDLGSGSGVVQLMVAMMGMMNSQTAQTTQLLLGVLNSGREDSRAFVQSMANQSAAHSEQMARLMQAITQAGQGSGNNIDQVLSAVQTGVDLAKGAAPASPDPDSNSELGALAQGMAALAELSRTTGAGMPPVLPPNGGAGA